jgi:NADPH:quinone reductase-like Zn-dependent oxidoreductase
VHDAYFPQAAGAYAEFVAARKPASPSHVEVAALPLVGLTAWQALVDIAGVQAGQRVLIHVQGKIVFTADEPSASTR